jgi:hypothetical protein
MTSEVAQRLPAEEALAVALGIDDARSRVVALAEVAQRLPTGEQPSALGEALSTARGIDDARWRSLALEKVALRLPAEEALAVVRGIEHAGLRTQTLAEVAQRLDVGQIANFSMHQWMETIRLLAMRTRDDCVGIFAAILPFIDVLGGETTVCSLGRSIASVRTWWP